MGFIELFKLVNSNSDLKFFPIKYARNIMQLSATIKKVSSKVLFELTIVSVGILLALAVNAWFQNYQQQQQAQALLSKIEYEINQNLTNLQDVRNALDHNIADTSNTLKNYNTEADLNINLELKILDVDFAVWNFSQHRAEFDRLPVDLLISISESYRALEKADLLSNQLASGKFEQIVTDMQGNEKTALTKLLNELQRVKFQINIAQNKLESSAAAIKQYH